MSLDAGKDFFGQHHDKQPDVGVVCMSLRDYFAGQALTGMLSQPADRANVEAYDYPERAAAWAYSFADAMLAERAKGGAK